MKKRCIVNFANGVGWYPRGQARLIEACKNNLTTGDLITLNNYDVIGSPNHHDNPYAFKVYAIEYALKQGYTTILFVDSSLYPIKNCDAIFDEIESKGHLFQLAGHFVDRWCNDNCRNYFNLSREESSGMVMFSAGFTGLDFTNEKSVEFFKQWKASCEAGAFKGSWDNHRHDMTCASIIATRLGMHMTDHLWMCYIGEGYQQAPPESVFYCHPC